MTSIIKSRSATKHSPSTSSKSWVILQVSQYHGTTPRRAVAEQILCSVDSYGSVETAAAKLEGLLFLVFDYDPSLSVLRYVSLARNKKEGSAPLKTTLEHLVEHLRELEVWPSSEPGIPNLWGSGGNSLEIRFKPRQAGYV